MKRFPYLLTFAAAVLFSASSSAQEFQYGGLNYMLEDGVVYVGYNSDAEGDVVIPGTVRYEGVSYPVSGIGDGAFSWAAVSSVEIPGTVTFIGQQAFCGCYNMTSVSIPASVRTISDYAFDNAGLVSIEIPGTVETLGYGAFQGNGSLVSVVIGEGVKVIPDNLFANCWSLADVTLPEGLEEIGEYAFSGQNCIVSLELPASLKRIGAGAFQFASLSRLSVPPSVEYLGRDAFAYNSYVTMDELVIADSDSPLVMDGDPFYMVPVRSLYIGRDLSHALSFDGFALEEAATGGGCTRLDGLNWCCYALQKVTLHEGLKTIGEGAITLCDQLAELTIPSTVTLIEKGALTSLYGLRSLTFADGCEDLEFGEYVLSATDPEIVYNGREWTGEMSYFGYGSIRELTLAGGCRTARNWMQRSALEKVVLGEGVEWIEDKAFQQCEALVSVAMPSTVGHIGADAFSYCPNLSDIRLPDGVRYIGDNAFNGCPITSVNLSEGLEYLGGWSFACTRLREVTIPDGLEQIQWCAFLDCKELTDVTVGKDVTFIDTSAFGGLDEIENFILADSDASLSLSGMGVFGGSPVKNLMLGRQVHGSWFLQSGLETVGFSGGCRTVAGFDQAQMLKKIYFAPEVEAISEKAFSGSVRITDVICGGEVPPALDETAFIDYVYKNAMLDVPEGYEETYHITDGWCRFAMINGSYASVDAIDTQRSHRVISISGTLVGNDMSADEIRRLPSGVYIVDGCRLFVR